MEKTLARAIYRAMSVGESYSTSELRRLLGDEYYRYIPVELQGKNENKIIAREMMNVVRAGYASTEVKDETYYIVRGLKYDCPNRDWSKVPTQTYKIRYWTRTR